jgi:hypothetical protein
MLMKRETDGASAEGGDHSSRAKVAQILGVVIVLMVVALPVLFSDGDHPWNTIQTTMPFAGPVAVMILTDTAPPSWNGTYVFNPVVLHRPGAANETRIDYSSPITVTHSPGSPVTLDLTDGFVNQGAVVTGLNGHCCFPEYVFSLDGQTISTTTTGPGGILYFAEIPPSGAANLIRVDPTSSNDFTGDLLPLSGSWVTLTSSTDTDRTVVYSAPITVTTDWNPVTSRTSDTVFGNRHPALAGDQSTGDAYLLYSLGQVLNLLKFDPVTGNTKWEATGIVALDPPPDPVFNYFQLEVVDGRLAGMVPRDTDTVVFFTDDLGGPNPPSAVQYITFTGDPPGDHHAMRLDGQRLDIVRTDRDGTGTEIFHIQFPVDPTVPPNLRILEDNTLTGAFHNTIPTDQPFDMNRENTEAVEYRRLKPNMMFVVQGDPDTNQIRYFTVDVPIHFDGFESGTTAFWSTVN